MEHGSSQSPGDQGHGIVIPPTPTVKPETLWPYGPCVLLNEGLYTIGWQGWDQSRGGPGFAVFRRGADGQLKVEQRYQLSDEGWAGAWQALTALAPDMAEKVRAVLDGSADADRVKAREALDADRAENALIVTTNEIPGYRITQVHGDVFGLTVRTRNYFSNFGAQLRTLVGGEAAGYTKLLTDSRNEARARMWREARARGANAVVGMRFDCNEIGDIMSEIAAYGTAVTVEPDPATAAVRTRLDAPRSTQV